MSLIDKVHKALENDFSNKNIIFESDMEDEEAYAFDSAINPNNGEDPLDAINLTDDEMAQLEKEIEEDLKNIDDTQEEDPDLKEDEDDISYESLLGALTLEGDTEINADEDDDDLDEGLDAVGIILDEEIDAIIDADLDIDDFDDLS